MVLSLKDVFIAALHAAYQAHNDLGVDGETLIRKNQFGDTALKVDIECEKAVLKELQNNNVPIKVISEEHGVTAIGNDPRYLGILDGLDGSSLYKAARGRKNYGTMFAIFSGTDPTYNDYLVCGIMQHATNRLYIAEKDHGTYILEGDKKHSIHTSEKPTLDSNTKIFIDEFFDYNRETFSKHFAEFDPKYEGASSLYYAALVDGSTDLVLECTRKGNLEIAVEYGLTKEAGGAVVDLHGNDIGTKKYLSFYQDEHIGIISAATQSLAMDIVSRLRK